MPDASQRRHQCAIGCSRQILSLRSFGRHLPLKCLRVHNATRSCQCPGSRLNNESCLCAVHALNDAVRVVDMLLARLVHDARELLDNITNILMGDLGIRDLLPS